MGNAASIVPLGADRLTRAGKFLFKTEQITALEALAQFDEERTAFTDFLKDGLWLDEICLNCNFGENLTSLAQKAIGSDRPPGLLEIHGFAVPEGLYLTVRVSLLKLECAQDLNEHDSGKTEVGGMEIATARSEASRRGSMDTTATSVLSGGETQPALLNAASGDYFDLDHRGAETGFSKLQLLSIMFLVLHPIYMKTKAQTDSISKKNSRICFLDQYSQCRCLVPCAEPVECSPAACRAQELLLAAAACFDEERMLQTLSGTQWLKQIPAAIEGSVLGIAVCEVRSDRHFPIVYSNSAMHKITGYSARALQGQTFALFEGAQTEPEQIQRLHTLLSEGRTTKLGITHYKRNGAAFTNLLAVQPVYDAANNLRYVASVTFDPARSDASMLQLQQVDVILALLPLILTRDYAM
jgi:PAS domain S-box-containing protein